MIPSQYSNKPMNYNPLELLLFYARRGCLLRLQPWGAYLFLLLAHEDVLNEAKVSKVNVESMLRSIFSFTSSLDYI